jgi:succinate-acetate transporter protein
LIYLPGSGILAAYTDTATGELNSQFPNALAMYLWAWFILTVIFTIAAMRSSWVLFLDLFFLDIVLMLLACGYMLNMPKLETVGSALGFVVALLSCEFPVSRTLPYVSFSFLFCFLKDRLKYS